MRLHKLTPICRINLLLTGILWNSVDTFKAFPCFWNWLQSLINHSMSLSILCQKNLSQSFLLSCISHPRYETFVFAFESLRNPSWTSCIIPCCCCLEEITKFVFCTSLSVLATKRTKRFPKFLQICFLSLSPIIHSEKEFSCQYFSSALKPLLNLKTVDFNYNALTFTS